MQGTAPRLPVKKRCRGTPRRKVHTRLPTTPLRGICHLTLGGRLQAPEGAQPSRLVAAGPHQRAVGVHRRPPPHRRRRPAACLTREPCSNSFCWPWLKCGSQRSTGKAATVHRRTRRAVLRRLRTFPNSCFCAQRTQRRTKPFTAVSSSHRPLQTEPKWRNCTGSCVDCQIWLSGFFELRERNPPQPRDPFLIGLEITSILTSSVEFARVRCAVLSGESSCGSWQFPCSPRRSSLTFCLPAPGKCLHQTLPTGGCCCS